MGGKVSHHGGVAAEAQVAAHYQRGGREIAARRWRGPGGEIDLIAREGNRLVFVEVKKSSSFARAAERLSRRQMDRICRSAAAYLAREPLGQNTEVRFDVALVDGFGRIDILENAFGEY
ncbi:MAG: YraN family protein [Defluviimonas sp.]|nr:YraN family protein [Defluviimonas sp.]